MATLHLINASSHRSSAMLRCLSAATNGDTVLLIENGVFCAVAATFAHDVSKATGLNWCALIDDARVRGIEHRLAPSIALVDDRAFVDLVVSHQPIVSWS
jgi:tRNA 2-thiouridine synthesizing protein B